MQKVDLTQAGEEELEWPCKQSLTHAQGPGNGTLPWDSMGITHKYSRVHTVAADSRKAGSFLDSLLTGKLGSCKKLRSQPLRSRVVKRAPYDLGQASDFGGFQFWPTRKGRK